MIVQRNGRGRFTRGGGAGETGSGSLRGQAFNLGTRLRCLIAACQHDVALAGGGGGTGVGGRQFPPRPPGYERGCDAMRYDAKRSGYDFAMPCDAMLCARLQLKGLACQLTNTPLSEKST